jgi:pre-mRNA-processing factor 6
LSLDKKSGSVSGTSTVDRKGYLTELGSRPVNSESDIGDFKKARAIVKSIINCNPKNPDGYISAARVEVLDGKI